ncbi:trypsin-like serine peptidase [Pyxidicoccus trucidator]|uniref:trypsin-like serine peptidase n=1 Tax=Pyxidicoccus trucidator TaxID=2709662 RepID=UPI0013D9464D|nr:serine protease [Pyxidicoccus trucidator]
MQDAPLATARQGSICGPTEDWSDVEPWASAWGGNSGNFVLRSQRAVALIRHRVTGVAQCTGSLIAENILLTAGHCFSSTADALNYEVVFDYQVDTASTPRTTTVVQIAEGLEDSTGGFDFAVVRLASNAGNTFGSLRLGDRLPTGSELLRIIQHPRGLMKKHHQGSYSSRALNGSLHYVDVDTDGGSSGSPVLSTYGDMVAVHTNGGCTSAGGTNSGTSMVDIYDNSTVIPALVHFETGGNTTSLGRITMSTSTQSCTRGGNWHDMVNGCGLRLNVGDVVTVNCTTNGQSGRWLDGFFASGATLSFSAWSDTNATATFTYTGTGVRVFCNFID